MSRNLICARILIITRLKRPFWWPKLRTEHRQCYFLVLMIDAHFMKFNHSSTNSIKNLSHRSCAKLRKNNFNSNDNFCNEHKTNIIPSYVRLIQRGFSTYWKYNVQLLVGSILNHPHHGFKTVLDNYCHDIQAKILFHKATMCNRGRRFKSLQIFVHVTRNINCAFSVEAF